MFDASGANGEVMVDAQAVSGRGGGVPRVARELMEHLLRRDASRRYHLIGNGESLSGFPREAANLSASVWLASARWKSARVLKQYFLDARRINRLSPRIYFAPATLIPRGIGKKTATISLIHDLAQWKVGNIYSPLRSRYMRMMLRDAARRADHVVSVSAATKDDLTQILSVPEGKISVIHNGVSGASYRKDPTEIAAHRQRLNLPERYVLFVGKIQPRKNLRRLLKAFAALSERPETRDVRLVLAGQLGWMYKDVLADLRSSPARDKVVMPGFVAEADLPWLYRCAELFSYPSLYEGFGLPILEAMQNGTPVVTSGFGAMREVAGAAAVTCDPYDIDALIESHFRLLTDGSFRDGRIEAGYANLRRFSWESAADQYVKLWERFA